MSATRLRAGKLIMIAFFAWALGFVGPASAQDEPVNEWKEFHEHHPEFDERLPEFKRQTEALMDSWQQYLSYELIDGTGWQFHDNFHLANLTINGLKHDWGREFDRWRLMYDRRTIELVSLARRYSDVQLTRKINSAVESDRKVSLYFYGSSPTSNVIHVVYHQTQMPQQIKWETFIHLVPKEQVFERSFTIPRSKPGEYSLTFEVGEKPGIVTLTYISLRDVTEKHTERTTIARSMIYGNVIDVRREASPKRAHDNEIDPDKQIKAYRRGNLTILVQDKSDKPIPAATVEIKQLRHYFLFGCNLDKLRLDDHSAFQRNYQQRFVELFNYAKLPCYWNAIEPQPGKRDYSKIEAAAKWCDDRNIVTNGYGLVSPFHSPTWAPKDFRVGVGQLRTTVTDCIRTLGDKIHSWDVVDELAYAQAFPKTNVFAQWLKQDNEVGVIERALLWAQAASGEHRNTFIVNEINGRFIPKLKQHENLPDAIGLVCGMQNQLLSTTALWQCLEDTTNYDKPLHLTELSVLSGECRPTADYLKTYDDWPSTKNGEAKQADYVVKVYKILFSNPKLASISWRDLSDQGAWMGAPGGLLRKDGTPKPAYNRLMDLIHKQWWTPPESQATDEKGGARFKEVFFGDYSVTVHDTRGHTSKKIVTFTPASQQEAGIIQIGN